MRNSEPKSDNDETRLRRREIVDLLTRAVVRHHRVTAIFGNSEESDDDAQADGLIESENDRSL
ncbi:hypothetical protein [Crateriforma spongiae]|uniref:hypothetical protein n=1 Tax=Crateriforma spongiae TaxID=2724528 RepID=UPI001444B791|nr:hypothetical protein [Crateriforma spongiae]